MDKENSETFPKSATSSSELLTDNVPEHSFPAFQVSTVLVSASPILPQYSNTKQKRILAGLIIAYFGYYFCRTNIILCINLIVQSVGTTKSDLGYILSIGYFTFAMGKLFLGVAIDRLGGKLILFTSLLASVLITLLIGLIPIDRDHKSNYLSIFAFLWCTNRVVQSGGWGAVVAIISKSFPVSMHGQAIGIATVSYGLGDAAVRMILGFILEMFLHHRSTSTLDQYEAEYIWKRIFMVSAVLAGALLSTSFFLLRHTRNVFYSDIDQVLLMKSETTLGSIVRLFKQLKFCILLMLAFSLTFVRETILIWLSSFLADYLKMNDGDSAILSLLFPLFGSFSTVFGGWLIDRTKVEDRGRLLNIFLSGVSSMFFIIRLSAQYSVGNHSVGIAAILISTLAFTLLAPFAYVDTIFPLDLCSSSEIGITVGVMSFVGYIGAILAGHEVGRIAETSGWIAVLNLLLGVSITCWLLGAAYWKIDKGQKIQIVKRDEDESC